MEITPFTFWLSVMWGFVAAIAVGILVLNEQSKPTRLFLRICVPGMLLMLIPINIGYLSTLPEWSSADIWLAAIFIHIMLSLSQFLPLLFKRVLWEV
jgi:hypothetical protein